VRSGDGELGMNSKNNDDLTDLVAERTRELELAYADALKLLDDLRKENAARRESEQDLRLLFERLPSGVVVHAADTAVLFANPEALRILGLTLEQMQGKTGTDPAWCFLREDGGPLPLEDYPVNRVLASGESFAGRILGICLPDRAEPNWVQWSAYPQLDENGQISQVIVAFTNITELKQAEKRLQEKEDRLSKVCLAANDGMWEWDLVTNKVRFDPRYYQMAGYDVDEFPHELAEFTKRVHPDDVEYVMGEAERHLQGTIDRFCVQFRFKNKSGAWQWIQGKGSIVERTPEGVRQRFVGTHRDISELKQVENALRSNYALLQIAGETAKFGGWSVDLVANICTWSDAVADIHDMPRGYAPPVQESISFYAPEWQERITRVFRACSEQGIPYDEEMEILTSKGKRVWVRTIGQAVKDKNGTIIHVQGSFQDITERKQAEDYRAMGVEVLDILNEPRALPDAIQRIVGMLKTRTGFDAVGLRLQDGEDFPYSAQDGFSKTFLLTENTLIERDKEGGVCRDKNGSVCLECTCGLVVSGKTDATSPLFTRGGSCWTNDSFQLLDLPGDQDPRHHPRNQCIHDGYASIALIPIRAKDKIVGLLHFTDRRKGRFNLELVELLEGIASRIGEALLRKQAETELKEAQTLTESIVDNVPIMIYLKDATDLRFLRFNRAGEELLGHDRKDVIGKTDKDFFSPEVAAEFLTKERQVLDGTIPLLDDVAEIPLMTQKKGPRWLHTRKVCIRGSDGAKKYLLGIAVDITERKRAETAKSELQAQLQQAQKLESVGRLAGGVAHDFNNLLMGIMGYTDLCLENIQPDHPIREWLDEIISGAKRSSEITRQLLAFARKQTIAPRVLDLNDAVAEMLKLLQRLIGEDIRLTWKPCSGLRLVKLDPSQVDQILVNLCLNARDAIDGVGEIALEVGSVTVDAAFCAIHPEAIPGVYVYLTVSDDGCGMDREMLAQIFEPFFTTKGVGKGTGLGLATVYGIAKQNNGFINVYSERGKGTTFKIYLPEITAENVATMETTVTDKAEAPRGQGETVLLVEDEKSLSVLCCRILESLGYNVLMADTPEEALIKVDQHPGDIQILLTDVIMPGMDGRILAQRVSAIKPEIKVLFMSGYTADVIAQRGVLDEGVQFISKPFNRNKLARTLRQVLDTSPAAPSGTAYSRCISCPRSGYG